MLHRMRTWLFSIAAVALFACGSSAPSDELVSARKAYGLAERSKAKELAPDRLFGAEQALQEAESAHKNEARSARERTLAYVAERAAKLAIAYGNMLAANEEAQVANQEYRDELEGAQKRTSGKLADTEDDLKAARADLERRESELAQRRKEIKDRESELAKNKGELQKSKQELEKERQARLAAEQKAAEALKKLEEFSKISQEKRGLVITLSGEVLFKSGKANILPLAREKLRQVSGALLEMEESKMIVVEGHTDSRGKDSYNRELSRARANAVRSFLIAEGVPATRVTAVGKGEDEPIASNRTADGRANNRRVEIVVK